MTDVPLIEIEGLRVIFHGDDGRATHAVDRVDLSVANGATLGLVGESGCGKSVTSLAIMGLLSKHSAEVTGSIRFDGLDLLDVPDQTLRDLRVDDHADPLAELERLEQVSRERWVHFRKFLPSRRNPAGITDRATIDAGVAAGIAGDK